ncbi:MAG TPA: glycosyltransferase 87 family protein, partial [Aquihabitans sp.]|nr:glycosyltransferase 87 family protein [Aquihabitans sp.]
WQGLSGAAVLGAVVLLQRRTGSGLAMAAVGLNPLVGYHLVNLAHNDAVIGLAVLGAVVLADDDHDVGAAVLLTVAALVKAPTGIGLLALLLWIGHRKGWARASRAGVAAGALGLAAMAVAGGRAALEPMLGARGRTNGYTPWNLLREGGTEIFRGNSIPDLPFTVGGGLSTAALAASVAGALAVAAARTWRPRPADHAPSAAPSAGPAVAGALVMWTLLSLYTSPWSFGWVLPVLALHLRSWLSRAVLAYVALFTVTAQWGILTIGARWLEQPGAAGYDDVNAVAKSLLLLGLLAIVGALAVDAARRLPARSSTVSDVGGRSVAVPGPR